jgi:hypothetical protein
MHTWKNMKLYAQKGVKSILVQITQDVRQENQNIIQLKTFFHVLAHGRPMLEYESSMYCLLT